MVCWRMVWPAVVDGWRLMLQAGGCWPFWVPERQGGRETPPGVVVLSVASRAAWRWSAGGGLLGGLLGSCWWSAGDGWAVVIRRQFGGGDSAVFNQLLTIFLAVAMVWWLPVFFLCSDCLFWRLLGRFRLPGAGAEVGGLVVVLGELSTGTIKGGGSGKRVGVFLGLGKIYSPTSSPPLHGLWGWRKTGRGSFCNPGLKSSEPHAGLSKISSFYWTCFERKLCYFEDRETI